MRRNKNVFYSVTTYDGYWWQRGKWLRIKDIDSRYNASSNYDCLTFKQAIRCASRCPGEMVIVKFFYKHGKRMEREYILRKE